jgi:hypothetical protein
MEGGSEVSIFTPMQTPMKISIETIQRQLESVFEETTALRSLLTEFCKERLIDTNINNLPATELLKLTKLIVGLSRKLQ